MEEKLLELETLLDQKFEDWTEETIFKIINNISALELFTPEIIMYLVENRTNERVMKILQPVRFGFYLNRAFMNVVNNRESLKNEEMTQEEFDKAIFELKDNSETEIERVIYYLTIINDTKSEFDLSKEKDSIISDMKAYKDIMLSVDFEAGFELLFDMLDILFSFREHYFNTYGEDLMKDDYDLDPILDRLNEMTNELMQVMAQQEHDKNHVHDENCDHDHDEE